MSFYWGMVVIAVTVALTGCGSDNQSDWPATYPVTGTVIGGDGAKMTAGAVQFQPVDDAKFTAMGNIQSDGSFAVETSFVDGTVQPGAIEGSHRVTIYPYAQSHSGASTHELAQPFEVKAEENVFELKVGANR